MVKKIRLIRTMVVEYEPFPEAYDDDIETIEQMAQFDANAEDRELIFDDCVSDTVKWEIIEVEE